MPPSAQKGEDCDGNSSPRLLPADAAFKNSFLLFPVKLRGTRTPEMGINLSVAYLPAELHVRRSPQEPTSGSARGWFPWKRKRLRMMENAGEGEFPCWLFPPRGMGHGTVPRWKQVTVVLPGLCDKLALQLGQVA